MKLRTLLTLFLLLLLPLTAFSQARQVPVNSDPAATAEVRRVQLGEEVATAKLAISEAALASAQKSAEAANTSLSIFEAGVGTLCSIFLIAFSAMGWFNIRNAEAKIETRISESLEKKLQERISGDLSAKLTQVKEEFDRHSHKVIHASGHFFYDRAKRRHLEAKENPLMYQACASNIIIAAKLFHQMGNDTFARNFMSEFQHVIEEAGRQAESNGVHGLVFEEEMNLVADFAWLPDKLSNVKFALAKIEKASRETVARCGSYLEYVREYGEDAIKPLTLHDIVVAKAVVQIEPSVVPADQAPST